MTGAITAHFYKNVFREFYELVCIVYENKKRAIFCEGNLVYKEDGKHTVLGRVTLVIRLNYSNAEYLTKSNFLLAPYCSH